jgi:hypothetical protein
VETFLGNPARIITNAYFFKCFYSPLFCGRFLYGKCRMKESGLLVLPRNGLEAGSNTSTVTLQL